MPRLNGRPKARARHYGRVVAAHRAGTCPCLNARDRENARLRVEQGIKDAMRLQVLQDIQDLEYDDDEPLWELEYDP